MKRKTPKADKKLSFPNLGFLDWLKKPYQWLLLVGVLGLFSGWQQPNLASHFLFSNESIQTKLLDLARQSGDQQAAWKLYNRLTFNEKAALSQETTAWIQPNWGMNQELTRFLVAEQLQPGRLPLLIRGLYLNFLMGKWEETTSSRESILALDPNNTKLTSWLDRASSLSN